MDEKQIHKPLEEFTDEQIRGILNRKDIDELISLPISVSEYLINLGL